jgi:hypothetical protein
MSNGHLPPGLQTELRAAKRWYGLAAGFFVVGYTFSQPALLLGSASAIYGMFLESRAKKKAEQWRKENNQAEANRTG